MHNNKGIYLSNLEDKKEETARLDALRSEMSKDQVEFLEQAQTKHLIGLLKKTRVGRTAYYVHGAAGVYTYGHQKAKVKWMKKGGIEVDLEFTRDELKTELRNRENLVNYGGQGNSRWTPEEWNRTYFSIISRRNKGRNHNKCVKNKRRF